MRLPAGRAGLCFSLSITTCGMTNFPLTTSLAAIPCIAENTARTSLGFWPVFDEMAANNPPADMDVVLAFIAFIAFIALAMVPKICGAGGLLGAGDGLASA